MSMKRLQICQALMLAGMMTAAAAGPASVQRTYIVQLADAPVANYEGGKAGLAATKVAPGQKLDVNGSNVRAYRSHLEREHRSAAAAAGGSVTMTHRYDLAFNGFAAVMTEAQAQQLQASGKVLSVTVDEKRRATTITTPGFLGLDGPGGLWSRKLEDDVRLKGENIVIAVIDSGVQPESPAFYDRVNRRGEPVKTGGELAYGPPPRDWKGSCTTGPGFAVDACNNKLIGAKVFNAGFKAAVTAKWVVPFFGNFYDVPRDETGHGTHTLSTAGGNAKAPAVAGNGVFVGTTSGIAPRARLASYKALFGEIDPVDGLTGVGYTSDLVAAIDAAVADGVDVINYSISGSQYNMVDAVGMAFLNASAAGVFVAASAGNSGPGNQVNHPNPWVTTVGASTHDRQFITDLSLGDGSSFTGASFNLKALPSAAMVLSSDVAGPPVKDYPPNAANLCFLNSLDPAKVSGKIVVCDRGVNDRVEKSAEVKRAGGVGMVLINPTVNNLAADIHSVPSIHLPNTARLAVRAYVATATPTGSIGTRRQDANVVAPVMASFSSRGPNKADSHVMKPDITAPGVDVIASVSMIQATQAEHDAILAGTLAPAPVVEPYQGTSMSSPHVAGAAALIKQAHPKWTPAMIKSALMTTATPVKLTNGVVDANLYGYGAGHLNPKGANDPGLVYDASLADHVRFLCGAQWLAPTGPTCNAYGAINPDDLNQPSIAVTVLGTSTVTRKVTNVGKETSRYTASANVPGFTTVVSPATLKLPPGKTGVFTATFTTTTAAVNSRSFGSLAWSDGRHTVTSPVQARAVHLLYPPAVSSKEATGSSAYPLTYYFDGATSSLVAGLKAATRTDGSVAKGKESCVDIAVPAGALMFRSALYDAETGGLGGDDLDLSVYAVPAAPAVPVPVGYSGGVTANEMVSLASPAAGNYRVCVEGYAPKGGLPTTFTLSTWVVSAADAGGGLTATGLPSTVSSGMVANVNLSWAGLVAGTRYLGGVRYFKGDGSNLGTTLVTVEPTAASPATAAAAGQSRR